MLLSLPKLVIFGEEEVIMVEEECWERILRLPLELLIEPELRRKAANIVRLYCWQMGDETKGWLKEHIEDAQRYVAWQISLDLTAI